jgi:hypothetical protein
VRATPATSTSVELRRCPQLPVIFICENNQYVFGCRSRKHGDRRRGDPGGDGFDGVAINGNDVLAVYQATGRPGAGAYGDGPTLIECKTYRWHGHSEHDKAFYRTDEELAMWKSRDPIRRSRPTWRGTCSTIKQKDRGESRRDDRRGARVRDEFSGPEAGGCGHRPVCMLTAHHEGAKTFEDHEDFSWTR